MWVDGMVNNRQILPILKKRSLKFHLSREKIAVDVEQVVGLLVCHMDHFVSFES